MKVIIAKRAGFCFGVKRAVDLAFEEAKKKKSGVVTLGPIIHNPQVVGQLGHNGVKTVDDISDIDAHETGTVIIRTHGIPVQDMQKLDSTGLEVIDATCPFVKKAQQYAKLLRDEGYKVVILGDSEHPEVKGIMSYAGDDVIVLKSAGEYQSLKGRVGIIVQTTKQISVLKELVSVAVEHALELKVYNTICNSTALRLKETEQLAAQVDMMIIVGGRNSANTTRLASFSTSLGVPTRHIETCDEVQDAWFDGVETVGITAGASTPDWIIEEVEKRIFDIGGSVGDGTGERGT
jgi:4-hydroxy-3-methylbut-2-enyl diphosphate reductase